MAAYVSHDSVLTLLLTVLVTIMTDPDLPWKHLTMVAHVARTIKGQFEGAYYNMQIMHLLTCFNELNHALMSIVGLHRALYKYCFHVYIPPT